MRKMLKRYRVRPVSYVLEEQYIEDHTDWAPIFGPDEDVDRLTKLCIHLAAGETEDLLPNPETTDDLEHHAHEESISIDIEAPDTE